MTEAVTINDRIKANAISFHFKMSKSINPAGNGLSSFLYDNFCMGKMLGKRQFAM